MKKLLCLILIISVALAGTLDLSTMTSDITIQNFESLNYFPTLASGDINNDGIEDLLVGDVQGGASQGAIHLFFGSANFPSTLDMSSANMSIYGNETGDQLGFGVGAGDINNDGYDDILMGARRAEPFGRSGAGQVYVWFGNSAGNLPSTVFLNTTSANITLYGRAGSNLGYSFASCDINNDDYDELIVGAPKYDHPGRVDSGTVYVLFGNSTGNLPTSLDLDSDSTNITIKAELANDRLGFSLACGDMNNNSYADFVAGGEYVGDADVMIAEGGGFVFFGNSTKNLPTIWDLSITPANISIYSSDAGDKLGQRVSINDLNNDNYDDILIAGPLADVPGGVAAGKIYVFYGGLTANLPSTIDMAAGGVANVTLYADDQGDRLGWGLDSGDIDNDGYYDRRDLHTLRLK